MATAFNFGFAAPLLHPAGVREVPIDEFRAFAPRTEIVELDVGGGAILRGVFTPTLGAVVRRGVVLHLLPARASLTTGMHTGKGQPSGVRECAWFYAQLGWDSLMLDYRGIGASSGKRAPEHFAVDGLAMLAAARQRMRVGDRLLVRAVSIGCLPLAALLDAGAHFDGAVAHAPVEAATLVGHGTQEMLGGLLGGFVARLFRQPDVPDLTSGLAGAPRSLFVLPEQDRFHAPVESQALERAALEHGHVVKRLAGFDHKAAACRAMAAEWESSVVDQLPPEELQFLGEIGQVS